MKSYARKSFVVMVALLFAVVFSWSDSAKPVMAGTNNNTKPTVEFTDYHNGTTVTVIDYQNGTKDVISETMQMKTAKYVLDENTMGQSISLTLPTSTEESTDWVPITQDLVLGQEVLMGFTYDLVTWRWEESFGAKPVAWLIISLDVDIGFGLRLPVRIVLEYPEQMTVEHDYVLNATLVPLDREGYNEFRCKFIAKLSVDFGVAGKTIIKKSFGPDYDWSKSFTTPLGPDMEFPIPDLDIVVWDSKKKIDIDLLKLILVIDPKLGSDKITAKMNAAGDASGMQDLTWTEPGQKIPFTVHADDYGPTDEAEIQLSDFRYYFSLFEVAFNYKLDFEGIFDWLGDIELPLFKLDLSWLTDIFGELYLQVHPNTPGTVDVSRFVKKFGIDLVITPSSHDIVPGVIETYDILVVNKGNYLDTFTLSSAGLPGNWWYELSSAEVSLDAYDSVSIQLSVQPYRSWSTSPGNYSFTVTGTSQQAPLNDLAATDTVAGNVRVLAFYEVDAAITTGSNVTEPGGTGVYTIEVTNLGNVLDSFDVDLSFADFNGAYRALPTSIQTEWTTIDKTYMTLDPGSSDIAALSITIPSDWTGIEDAIYEYTATATSETDPTANDDDTAVLMVQATKESTARYTKLELQWLADEVSASGIYEDVRYSLLDKLNSAIEKEEQALNCILTGEDKHANNMFEACTRITHAFINQAEAQVGKHIPEVLAESWIIKAEDICDDLGLTKTI